jgi:ribosomal protein S18 acetylase RimI-like enzyme
MAARSDYAQIVQKQRKSARYEGLERATMSEHTRVMRLDDLTTVNGLLRRAYNNPLNDYTSRLLRHLELQPDGWLVMEREEIIIACGGGTAMGTAGYIGLVGVDPTLQRQGVGVALMCELIALLAAQGCATILLDASDMGKPLYLKLSFVIDDTISIWHTDAAQPLPAAAAPGGVSVTPYQPNDLAAVIACDTIGFGAPRDRIVTAFLNDTSETSYVARDASGAVVGYLALDPVDGFIGPWLTTSVDAGEALLRHTLAKHGAHVKRVMTPDANHAAARLLRAAGFAPVRTLAHMRLGPALNLARRQSVYGQINLALG